MTPQGEGHVPKIMLSRCLLGEPVRYDGTAAACQSPIMERWKSQGRLVAICPELEGGCPVPRPPAEIIDGDGAAVLEGRARVVDIHGSDTTEKYFRGAWRALEIARRTGVAIAVLKARSPSCGKAFIYDGTFSCTLKPGMGVTAALLSRNGILVFDEEEIAEADEYLSRLEQGGLRGDQ